MKGKDILIQLFMTFIVVTACVTILEGVMGVIFMPDTKIGFGAFFSPPLFGFLTSLLGIVTLSTKELTIRQAVIRKLIHLGLIEILVFGLNAAVGNVYEIKVCIAIALSIAVVYITVNAILWVNDQRSAQKFNQDLRRFQQSVRNAE